MVTTLLKEIETNNGQFPKEILQNIIDRRDEFIPELLNILEYTCENAGEITERDNYFAHIYAIFLLAQFREKRAYPLIYRLISNSHIDSLLGDVITEGLPEILASVCDGDIELIKDIIENRQIDEYVRGSALKSLVIMVAQGIKARDEIVFYFETLFRGKFEKEHSNAWDSLAIYSYYLYPGEVIKDIELAYGEGLIDPFFIGFQDIKQQLENKKEVVLEKLCNDRDFQLVNDTISELDGWACFNENSDKNIDWQKLINFDNTISKSLQEPFRNECKVGRNDPCPCGSGKKYKKCCGK